MLLILLFAMRGGLTQPEAPRSRRAAFPAQRRQPIRVDTRAIQPTRNNGCFGTRSLPMILRLLYYTSCIRGTPHERFGLIRLRYLGAGVVRSVVWQFAGSAQIFAQTVPDIAFGEKVRYTMAQDRLGGRSRVLRRKESPTCEQLFAGWLWQPCWQAVFWRWQQVG